MCCQTRKKSIKDVIPNQAKGNKGPLAFFSSGSLVLIGRLAKMVEEFRASLILSSFLLILIPFPYEIEAYCSGNNLRKEKFALPEDYQVSTPPESPTRVHLLFSVKHITDVNDVKNVIELQGSLTLTWNETRLITDDEVAEDAEQHLDVGCIHVLWTPDIWIENLVYYGLHDVMGDLASLTLVGSQLTYWQRWLLVLLKIHSFN